MGSLYKAILFAVATFTALAFSSSTLAAPASKEDRTGVVTHVVDGDTVRVRMPSGAKPISVRIYGIDAPEICQSGGTAARDALKRRVLGQRVLVQGMAGDDYGRLVARIILDKQDLGEWLVAQGLAWSYRYRRNAGPYASQQVYAQTAALGMFAGHHASAPVYPGEFRKRHGSCYARQH